MLTTILHLAKGPAAAALYLVTLDAAESHSIISLALNVILVLNLYKAVNIGLSLLQAPIVSFVPKSFITPVSTLCPKNKEMAWKPCLALVIISWLCFGSLTESALLPNNSNCAVSVLTF
jgi:hypothetical protein